MIPISKVACIISCGFLLGLGLSANAASAGDEMKAAQAGERIGGQAGRGYDQTKWERIVAQAGERIGGQAGRGYDQQKWERVAAQAGERIGGQAGRGY